MPESDYTSPPQQVGVQFADGVFLSGILLSPHLVAVAAPCLCDPGTQLLQASAPTMTVPSSVFQAV